MRMIRQLLPMGGGDQNAVEAPDPSHTGKRKRGKGSKGGDGNAPSKKERRKVMEFEDLVLEFDEILEDHARKEYRVNKTGG